MISGLLQLQYYTFCTGTYQGSLKAKQGAKPLTQSYLIVITTTHGEYGYIAAFRRGNWDSWRWNTLAEVMKSAVKT